MSKCIMKFNRYIVRYIILILSVFAIIINIELKFIREATLDFNKIDYSLNDTLLRNFELDIPFETLNAKACEINASNGELAAVLMAVNNYRIDEAALDKLTSNRFIIIRNHLMRFSPDKFKHISTVFGNILNDAQYFPVAKSLVNPKWVSFCNSWNNERTYGGKRSHEGTDIMADENKAGIYPVISVCDGTVTNIGWLELGGYRIGITSPNGVYYYYAHLDSYADNIKSGDNIKAGQLLGFMGNTGYSKVEGTKGKFDVHLHFGVYVDDINKNSLSLNPYFLLKHMQNKVLYYNN